MANLWSGRVNTSDEYADLETLSEQTFVKDTTYTVQIQNTAWIREGEDGEGFVVTSSKPFTITYGTDSIYIRTSFQDCVVNISDSTAIKF